LLVLLFDFRWLAKSWASVFLGGFRGCFGGGTGSFKTVYI